MVSHARPAGEVGGLLLVSFIVERGSAFSRWGVCPKCEALLCSLHSKSTARYGDHEEVIVTSAGGRQGCKVGSVIFNTTYAVAIPELQKRLCDPRVVLRLSLREGPFWATAQLGQTVSIENVLDATFVDDECLIFLARLPRVLSRNIETVIAIPVDIFATFQMQINWNAGKSNVSSCARYLHGCINTKLRL